MGKLIRIDQEHIYTLPSSPKKKDDVLFTDFSKKEQYWRRQTDIPQSFYDFIPGFTKENREATIYNQDDMLISLSVDDTTTLMRFLTREIHRRTHGVCFMNNGELTYLTGNHYFILQWGEMHGYINPETGLGFGEYRQFQRDIAYFVDIVEKEPTCAGGFIAKVKKSGVTQFISLLFLNESTMIKEKRFLMISKSHPDCIGTNMMFYLHGLERMPMIMKPAIKNQTLSKVVYDQPKSSMSNSKQSLQLQSQRVAAGGFKTFVEALATKADSFDGPKVHRGWADEFPKCANPYPKDIFDKSIESVKLQQSVILGKMFYTSYPPERDTRGFFEAKEIYFNSALSTKNQLGQTKTSLLKHFVGAIQATEGTNDKYGKPDEAKAFFINDTDRKSAGTDRRALQTKKRQYARDEREAWESGGAGSAFDNIRLSIQETNIETAEKEGAIIFIEGNLDWNIGFGSTVAFVPLTVYEKENNVAGKFRLYTNAKLSSNEINVPLRINRDKNGFLQPDENTIVVGAVDPTDYKEKKDVVEGSKNAIVIGSAFDMERNSRYNSMCTNLVIADYHYRDDDPDVIFEDTCMAIIYFGMYVVIEFNKGWLATMLKKKGFQNFLLVKDKLTGSLRPYQDGDELNTSTTAEVINNYCRSIARYIRFTEDEQEFLTMLHAQRIIYHLMNFDPNNTKKWDLAVAFGYWRLAVECLGAVKMKRIKNKELFAPDMVKGIVENILMY